MGSPARGRKKGKETERMGQDGSKKGKGKGRVREGEVRGMKRLLVC